MKLFKKDRVLVADDEEFCIASMKAILKKSGFDINNRLDICINGREMVDLVRNSYNQGISFKLIFSDFSMPGLNGVDAVREIRAFFESHKVPESMQPYIIGVTGHVHEDFTVIGLKAGMNEIVSKPLYYPTLLSIISKFF